MARRGEMRRAKWVRKKDVVMGTFATGNREAVNQRDEGPRKQTDTQW